MSQSLANVLIHTIFSTKNRRALIQSPVDRDLYSYIAGIAKSHGSFVYEVGGVEDHVHILQTLPRAMPVCKLVEEIKKSSSRWIKGKGIRYSDFAWQSGYGAFSIGQSGIDGLRKYIQDQKEHHKKISFQDEYRAFLKKYQVKFDENHMWD